MRRGRRRVSREFEDLHLHTATGNLFPHKQTTKTTIIPLNKSLNLDLHDFREIQHWIGDPDAISSVRRHRKTIEEQQWEKRMLRSSTDLTELINEFDKLSPPSCRRGPLLLTNQKSEKNGALPSVDTTNPKVNMLEVKNDLFHKHLQSMRSLSTNSSPVIQRKRDVTGNTSPPYLQNSPELLRRSLNSPRMSPMTTRRSQLIGSTKMSPETEKRAATPRPHPQGNRLKPLKRASSNPSFKANTLPQNNS